jgi:hypothetical protein
MSLRDAAKELILKEINQATTDLVTRIGEDYAWMRGQQEFVRGLTHAMNLIDEAYRTLGE